MVTVKRKENKRSSSTSSSPSFYLDTSTLDYFKNAEKLLDSWEFPDEESSSLFVSAVCKEIEKNTVRLCLHNDTSRVLEKLLPNLSCDQLIAFTDRINGFFWSISSSRFGSHVMQAFLSCWFQLIYIDKFNSANQNHFLSDKILNFWTELSTKAEFLFEMMHDPFASHVMRSFILFLSGKSPVDNSMRSKASQKYKNKNNLEKYGSNEKKLGVTKVGPIPEYFKGCISNIFDDQIRNVNSDTLSEFTFSSVASPILQVLLKSVPLADNSISYLIVSKLFHEFFAASNFEVKSDIMTKIDSKRKFVVNLATDRAGSHFLEAVVLIIPKSSHLVFYNSFLKSALSKLIESETGNFILQAFISSLKSQQLLNIIYEEMAVHFSHFIERRRTGLLISLLEAANKFPSFEKQAVKALLLSLHCPETNIKNLMLSLIELKTVEFISNHEKHELKICKSSPLLIKPLFGLPQTVIKPFVDSFLLLETDSLSQLAKDPSGSIILETVLKSSISSTVRNRIVRKLISNSLISFALDKYGSHVIDALYEISDSTIREKITSIFAEKKLILEGNIYGRICLRNCRVEAYQKSAEEWKTATETEQRRKTMFSDIINEDAKEEKSNECAIEQQLTLLTSGHEKSLDGTLFEDVEAHNEIDDVFSKKKAKTHKKIDESFFPDGYISVVSEKKSKRFKDLSNIDSVLKATKKIKKK